jgi:hypothetical protein
MGLCSVQGVVWNFAPYIVMQNFALTQLSCVSLLYARCCVKPPAFVL